jgi:hypothetical protein
MNTDTIVAELRKQRKNLKDQLSRTEKAIAALSGLSVGPVGKPKRRKMSAAARAKIAAFQKARWAKLRAAKAAKK